MLESLFNKVAGLKETPRHVLSCEYCEIVNNSNFYRTAPVAPSDNFFFFINPFQVNALLLYALNTQKTDVFRGYGRKQLT